MKPKNWNSDEINKLKRFVEEGLEDKEIAKKLNRTVQSIFRKRRRLFIYKRKEISSNEIVSEKNKRKLRDREYNKKSRKKNLRKVLKKDRDAKREKRTNLTSDFNNGNRIGYWKERLSSMKSQKRFKVEINEMDLENQWLKQNGRCFYTNVELVAEKPGGRRNTFQLVSIDRIDSNKHYMKDNISLVSFDANTMKRELSHEKFV